MQQRAVYDRLFLVYAEAETGSAVLRMSTATGRHGSGSSLPSWAVLGIASLAHDPSIARIGILLVGGVTVRRILP